MPINRMPTKDFINVKQRNRLDSLVTDVTPLSAPDKIARVRELCRAQFDKEPSAFDAHDVERFMNSDWTVTRFLLRKKDDPEEAADMMVSCARWRHKLGMPRWKDEDFPREFYNLGGVFPYESDLLGNTMIYVRAKLYDKKLSCIQELFQHYIIHIANRVDEERDGRGWAMVFDCSGTGMANLDVNMLLFMLNEVIPHLPKGLNYVLIYELPWLLSKIVNTTIACLPGEYKKLAKTASKKDIHNWIAKEALPDFMGGTCDINYRRAPPNSRNFEDMAAELKLTEKDLSAIRKIYQPYLDEAEEAIAIRKSKNVRRRSSVLEFWHWMKNKSGAGNDAPAEGSNTDANNKTADSAKDSANNKATKKVSVSKKDQPKLASIADEGDE